MKSIYTEQEKTMLELLDYTNPEGLHPNECRWRDLARKLKNDLSEVQSELGWTKYPDRMGQ